MFFFFQVLSASLWGGLLLPIGDKPTSIADRYFIFSCTTFVIANPPNNHQKLDTMGGVGRSVDSSIDKSLDNVVGVKAKQTLHLFITF